MATVTQQQLEAAGFLVVAGAGERFQLWAGPDVRPGMTGHGVTVFWDSVTGRRKAINLGDQQDVYRAIGAIAVILGELIAAIPNAVIPGATRQQMGTDLLSGLKDD